MKIGIDIGGSHIGIGLVNEKGEIVEKQEMFFKGTEDVKKVIEDFICTNISQMAISYDIESIGVAAPGTVLENKMISAVNLGLENYNLSEKIQSILDVKIKLRNDAKCAALAEKKYGELMPYENGIFLCLGTGIGGAVIYNGQLLKPKGVPGFEFGHTIIQKGGKQCNCGKRGCFEAYASFKKFKEKISEEFNLNSVEGSVIKEFLINNKQDKKLIDIVNTYIEDLSIGISNIINIFEPEVICIGGSFSEYDNMLNSLEQALIHIA